MSVFFTTLIIGISLSMDAFSLALIYGMQGMSNKSEIVLSLIVGVYHFVMPLIGLFFGNIILRYCFVNTNLFVGIVFSIIGIEMISSSVKGEDVKIFSSFLGYLLFGLSVSIDSFTTGIGLRAINSNYLEVSFIFMMCSGIFTYIGLKFGNKLSVNFGKYATIFGGGLLIILSVYYIFK